MRTAIAYLIAFAVLASSGLAGVGVGNLFDTTGDTATICRDRRGPGCGDPTNDRTVDGQRVPRQPRRDRR